MLRRLDERPRASARHRHARLIGAACALAMLSLGLARTADAQLESCTCFGQLPTDGCKVNGVVGPCIGTPGPDHIVGTRGNDVIIGLDGDDRIRGRKGADSLCGGRGDDRIVGTQGDDRIDGGPGDDRISGKRGADELVGGEGDDDLRAGRDDDLIGGDAGNDRIRAGLGNDVCEASDPGDETRACASIVAALPASCGDGRLSAGEQCEVSTDCDTALGETCDTDCTCVATLPSVYSFADACVAVEDVDAPGPAFLVRDGATFGFGAASAAAASPMVMKAADLGVFLLRDENGGHLVSDGTGLLRSEQLDSDVTLIDDTFESDAEWKLEPSCLAEGRYHLRHLKSDGYLTLDGITSNVLEAAPIGFHDRADCTPFPELTVDAVGDVQPQSWEDGSVFGFVDSHEHILSNFGFGGAGIFHGAAFHREGVEHALGDCSPFHGVDGRQDLFGYGFDAGDDLDPNVLLSVVAAGETPEPNHATDGYPTFTDWPSAHDSSTHQVQYYKWLERAYRGGLRLVVQHATTNQIICDFLKGLGLQPTRYSCNDMVAVDRIIDETYAMERYIDAQEGGPGQGWFRIVMSPAEARDVINGGKMAVILGIETANLFDCFLTPPPGFAPCDESTVVAKLDEYYARGVRVLFPVHKYDNAFSAGDGDKTIIELGNFINSSHYNNFTEDCDPTIPTVFDRGGLAFPGINEPRLDYLAPAPFNLSNFGTAPLTALLGFLDELQEPAVEGDFCQNAGLTDLGEFLILEIMRRGMVLEIDHLPRRSYKRAFELMVEHDYPASGSHGLNNSGALYALGGISTIGFGRCRDASQPGAMLERFADRIALIDANGGFPAEGFGLDLNGFAGAPGPRFGPDSVCSEPQSDPLTYPFTSYAGDVVFEQPVVGDRVIDFNTEGLAHIGLLPELIEEVRRDGATDADLAPLFRSAEAYLRVWEKSEQRASAIP